MYGFHRPLRSAFTNPQEHWSHLNIVLYFEHVTEIASHHSPFSLISAIENMANKQEVNLYHSICLFCSIRCYCCFYKSLRFAQYAISPELGNK